MKSIINNLLNEWGLPLFLGVIIISVLIGIAKNWDNLNDSSGDGRKKEAIMNLTYIVLYPSAAIAVLLAIVKIITGINISI